MTAPPINRKFAQDYDSHFEQMERFARRDYLQPFKNNAGFRNGPEAGALNLYPFNAAGEAAYSHFTASAMTT
jgi:hypothetical protein